MLGEPVNIFDHGGGDAGRKGRAKEKRNNKKRHCQEKKANFSQKDTGYDFLE
jgi:hypothetical protein